MWKLMRIIRRRRDTILFTRKLWILRWLVGWAKVYDGILEVVTLGLHNSWVHSRVFEWYASERNRAIKRIHSK